MKMTYEQKVEFLRFIPWFRADGAQELKVNTFSWRCCIERNDKGKWVFHEAILHEFFDENEKALGKVGRCPKCEKCYFFFYEDIKK